MSGFSWTRGAFALLATSVLAASLLTGCGDDKKKDPTTPGSPADPTVSAQMAGVWSITVTVKECSTGTPVYPPQTNSFTFCEGESVLGSVPQFDGLNCDITQSGNTYHIHCVETTTEEGCTSTSTYNLDMTYTNTQLQSTGQVTFSDSPSGCSGITGTFCLDIVGNRISGVPEGGCQ